MLRYSRMICWCMFCLGLVVPARGETVEEVEKKLTDAHGKLKSYTAKMKMVQDIDLGDGNRMGSDVDGTIEWMRKGEKFLYRTEIKGVSIQKFGGQESKVEQTSTMVSDGDLFFTLSEQLGQKMFIKQKADESIRGDVKSVFNSLRQAYDIKLAADEKVQDAECYVFEVTPKQPDQNPIKKTRIYFRKDNGLSVKTVGKDKDGKDLFTNTTIDIKFNVDIPADHFVLKAPDGVPVTDLTNVPVESAPQKP